MAEIGVNLWYKIFGKKVFLPSSAVTQLIADKICGKIGRKLCMEMVNLISGPTKNLNATRLSVYLSHCEYMKHTYFLFRIKIIKYIAFKDPAGTSIKNIVHFSQLVVSKNFQMYDYGNETENKKHYNQTVPPVYDVKNVKLPVALYCGGADWLADLNDVNILRNKLPNIIEDYSVDDWDHSDLVWASNATLIYYDRMLELMSRYK